MTRMVARGSFFIESFSFYHALCTLFIVLIALVTSVYFPTLDTAWLLLTAIMLSQVGLRSEAVWRQRYQTFYYLGVGLSAALLIVMMNAFSSLYVSLFIVVVVTAVTQYLGTFHRQFYLAAFFINVSCVIAILYPGD